MRVRKFAIPLLAALYLREILEKRLRFEIGVFGGVCGLPNARVKGRVTVVFEIGHAYPMAQCGQGAGAVEARATQLVRKIFDVPDIEVITQVLRGDFFDVVGLVQNEVFVLPEHGVFRDDVGKEQGVIDHHDMGLLGRAAHLVGKTPPIGAATLRPAIPGIGTHFCPQPGIAARVKAVVFRNVPGLRLLGPYREGQRANALVFAEERIDIGEGRLPPVEADVIPAAFEQHVAKGDVEDALEMGQVFEKQLLLKVFRIGGNDDAAAILHRVVNGRGQIGHGFAHAGSGFGNEQRVAIERPGNGAHHFDLLGAHLIAPGLLVKRATRFKQGAEHVDVQWLKFLGL